MAMGALGLAISVGDRAGAGAGAYWGRLLSRIFEMLGANPSMFAGTLLACDMGDSFPPKSWPAVMSRRGYTQG